MSNYVNMLGLHAAAGDIGVHENGDKGYEIKVIKNSSCNSEEC